VDIAFSLAKCLDATVLIFAVARPPEPATSVELEAVLDDAELVINEDLRKERVDADSARRTVEARLEEVVSTLSMNAAEEEGLRRAALEGLHIPFEFEKGALLDVVRRWKERREDERAERIARVEASLKQHLDLIELVDSKVMEMERALAIAKAMRLYSMNVPVLGEEGEGFTGGRNPFLVRESVGRGDREVLPVSYSLGRALTVQVAKPRNVAVLTGANSGGKTTLLTTLASVHILTLFGLPVPCVMAEVVPLPVYLFRKRVTRRIGSLEHALSSLIPVFGDRRRKLVLIDEFEALTEPGAARGGRRRAEARPSRRRDHRHRRRHLRPPDRPLRAGAFRRC
jgi:hypothetical protein